MNYKGSTAGLGPWRWTDGQRNILPLF